MGFKLSNGFHIVGWVSKDVLQREFWGFFMVLVLGVFLLHVECDFLMMETLAVFWFSASLQIWDVLVQWFS